MTMRVAAVHEIDPNTTGSVIVDPGVHYLVTAPLGPHPLLMDIVEDRVQYCLAHTLGESPECEVCEGTQRCQLR